MADTTDVYCSTCFSMPGEPCVSKYLVHGDGVITPCICPTHAGRTIDSERQEWHRTLSHKPLLQIPAEIPE